MGYFPKKHSQYVSSKKFERRLALIKFVGGCKKCGKTIDDIIYENECKIDEAISCFDFDCPIPPICGGPRYHGHFYEFYTSMGYISKKNYNRAKKDLMEGRLQVLCAFCSRIKTKRNNESGLRTEETRKKIEKRRKVKNNEQENNE